MKIVSIIYFTLGMLVVTTMANAQNGGVTLGVKVGFSKPQLRGDDANTVFPSAKSSWSPNFLIGLSANSKSGKNFWLKHDIFYAERNFTLQESSASAGTYSSKFKRHYIDIYPISPTFHYKGLQIYAGPYLGILMNATIQHKNAGGQLYDSSFYGNATQNSRYAQKFDYGYSAGIEYEFPFGVNIGLRYTKGFVPIIENAASQPQVSAFNSFTSFTVGYSFMRKSKTRVRKTDRSYPIPPLMPPTGKTTQ